jgi:hypothetical protein
MNSFKGRSGQARQLVSVGASDRVSGVSGAGVAGWLMLRV